MIESFLTPENQKVIQRGMIAFTYVEGRVTDFSTSLVYENEVQRRGTEIGSYAESQNNPCLTAGRLYLPTGWQVFP